MQETKAHVIRTFRDKRTEALYGGKRVRAFQAIEKQAARKLQMLDSATSLDDLRAIPGNRLEALGGDRRGQYSIRINDQWRLCFIWTVEGPAEVEIVDYH